MRDIKGNEIHIGDQVVLTRRTSRYGRHELVLGRVVALEADEETRGDTVYRRERVRILKQENRRLSNGTSGAVEVDEERFLREPDEVLVYLRGV